MKKSFLAKTVLASTIFGFFPGPSSALMPLTVFQNLQTSSAYPDFGTGYNYVVDNIIFNIDTPFVGNTGGIAVDNNNGNNPGFCSGGACSGDFLNIVTPGFTSIVGSVGTTHPIGTINTLFVTLFYGNVSVGPGNLNFIFNTTIVGGQHLFVTDGIIVSGNIDNLFAFAFPPSFVFYAGGQVTGDIGNTLPIGAASLNAVNPTPKTVEFNGATININNITLGAGGGATTLLLNNPAMIVTSPNGITSTSTNRDILDIKNAATINANIGAAGNVFSLVKVGANGNTTVNGNIFATTTQFQGNNKLIMGAGNTITGNVDSTSSGSGILNFLGNSTVTGTVGAVNSIGAISLSGGAGTAVTFQDTVRANSVDFIAGSSPLTTVNFTKNATLGGMTTTTSGNGIVNFLSNGTVTGTAGTSGLPINQINMKGAGSVLNFQGNIFANSLNFAAANVTANISNNVTITASVDDPTGFANDTLNFLGSGIMAGAVGTTNAISTINLKGINSVVEFKGNIKADNLNIAATNATALIDNNVTITGNVDNTTGAITGNLTFLGNSNVSGTIGATKALSTVNLTGASRTVVFQSPILNTQSFNFATSGISSANAFTTAKFADGISLSKIDNTTGSDGVGIAYFAGNGTVTGSVGATNSLHAVELAGAGKTVDFQGSPFNVQDLIFVTGADAATTAKLPANVTLSTIDNTTGANGVGTVILAGNTTVSGPIGSTKSINIISMNGPGALIDFQNSTVNVDNLFFAGAADAATTLMLAPNTTINTVDNKTGTPFFGNLSFTGNGIITGILGATDPLNSVNLLGVGSTVEFQQNNTFKSLNIAAKNATALLDDTVVLTANVFNTTGIPGNGTALTFKGDGTINGTIGTLGAPLASVNILGANADVNFTQNVFAQNINFTANANAASKIDISNSVVITGNIDNTTGVDGKGTVNFSGDGTVTGTIGATNALFEVNLLGLNSTVNLGGNINAPLNFKNNGITANIGNNASILAPTTTVTNDQGILNFLGNSRIDFLIGQPGLSLHQININGQSGTTVTLNNDIFATDTFVNKGGMLNVTGLQTDNGNLRIADGTLRVDHTASPFTVTGNFYLEANGLFDVDLGRNLPGGSVLVKGAAILDPNAMLFVENIPFQFANGNTVITLLTGNAASILYPLNFENTNLLFNFRSFVDDINHQLNLVITSIPTANFANLPNTTGIANTIDFLNNDDPTAVLQEIINQLEFFETADELNLALASLAPVVDGAWLYESYNIQQQTFKILEDRLDKKRFVRKGYNAGDFLEYFDEMGRGAWAKVFGQQGDQDARQGVAGYKDYTWGIAVGGDLMFSEHTLMGVAFNWARLFVNDDVSASTTTTADSYQGTIYGVHYFDNPLFINWYGAVAFNDYDINRNVYFGNVYLTPLAQFHGWQYGAKTELGYDLNNQCAWHAIPLVSLYYSHLGTENYTETGAGNASQTINKGSFNILQGGAGMKFVYDYPGYKMLVQPEAHARVFYNFINDGVELTSTFTGGGPSFETFGFTPPRVAYNLGASLTTFSDTSIIITASYDFEGKENYRAHSGFLRVRYEW